MPYADPTSEAARASNKRKQSQYYAKNKEARAANTRRWLEKNRDKANAWRREYNAAYPERKMLAGAKQRALRHGLEFSLTEWDIVIPETCPVLGIPIVRGSGNRVGGSPTLDRRDNSLGYVPSNVVVISHRANRLKADATLEEMTAIAEYMRQ